MNRFRMRIRLIPGQQIFFGSLLALLIAALLPPSGPLAQAPSKDPQITKQTLPVPMRDGAMLATDVYRIRDLGKAPVIVMRTWNPRDRFAGYIRQFAAAGYVGVLQSSRGTYDSDGEFRAYFGDGQDGYDTVEWARKQPWCDGRVAMAGASHMGSGQWLAAGAGAELDVAAPTAASMSFYHNIYLGGAYRLGLVTSTWGEGRIERPPDPGFTANWASWILHLPLAEMDKAVGRPDPLRIAYMVHNRNDGFWKPVDVTRDVEHMNFPAQHVVGYYDFMCRSTVSSFKAMRERSATAFSRSNQQLILGPWTHATGSRKSGDLDFGPAAEMDWIGENVQWMDRFLKQSGSSAAAFPPVRYFSMGDNTWRTASDWPPENAKRTPFYLRSGGHANTDQGDGALNPQEPGEAEPPDSFKADPANPVPQVPAFGSAYRYVLGPTDQRAATAREDVLVYSAPPLTEPIRFAGPLSADLYVSVDTPDADWVVQLIDVRPDGTAYPLGTGIQRGSFRDSDLHPAPLRPGERYLLHIDLGHAAATIPRGDSLRIYITGSCFPLFERNTNTAEGPESAKTLVALEKVWHTRSQASRIWLPVLR